MKLLPSSKIYIGESKIPNARRGVFALQDIKKDELIERCPIILLNESQVSDLRKTELVNYYFMWGGDKHNHKAAICLGFGSIYNHSYNPDAAYVKEINDLFIDFIALNDIKMNEEITINYNYGNPKDKTTLWIKSIPPAK